MIFSLRSLFLISFVGMIITGCAGNSTQPVSPVSPDSSPGLEVREELGVSPAGTNHYLMQYGYIFVDPDHPDGPQFEIVPARAEEVHLNILKYLEISYCTDCFSIVGLDFPEPGTLNVDILIEHPMTGLEYSVFDVRCIIMFNGSHEFPTSGKTISDPTLGDGAVLNPDGYTALYNGSTVTAPTGDLQKYFPGKLVTPVVPDSDINGYKYFISDDPLNNRNAFYAGSSDVQTFSLRLPTGPAMLGYAVDASWWTPISSPVEDPLIDFDTNANCIEPWKIVVTEEPVDEGLTDKGGQTRLLIDVYDWQGKSTYNSPMVECPEIFSGFLTGTWISDEIDYTRYEVTVSNDNKAPVGDYICLIGVVAIENNPADTPWLDLTAYQYCNLEVTDNTHGNLIWAKGVGGIYYDRGETVTTLSDNSTVVSGRFRHSATFGQGEPNETVLFSEGYGDFFIARYNPDGSLVWVKQAGGSSSAAHSEEIKALPDNSTIVAGYFLNSVTFGAGEPNETVLNGEGDGDIFIARYNPDGSLAWVVEINCTSWYESRTSITSLSDNSIVVTGAFSQSATFGQGEPNETVLNSTGPGDNEIFIARYNSDGSLEWVKQAGGPTYDQGKSITALSDDSTVVTGRFGDSAIFGQGEPNETILNAPGYSNIFIARYNPDGSLVWVKQAGGKKNNQGNSITTLSDDSTVVIGCFYGLATFGAGEPNETFLDSEYDLDRDIFIARYNPDGSLEWAKQAGGNSDDQGICITTLSDNSTAVTGMFQKSATFGPGEPNETILNSWGNYNFDIFIARYNLDGSLDWAKSAGGPFEGSDNKESGQGITALSDDSLVVTGWFTGYATFGQLEPNETVLHSVGIWDIFIARYAP